jgi:dihydroflavonol-4-reductase
MTILVTGATGLVGSNVVRLLLEQGESVRVFVREQCDPRPMEGLDVAITYGDVRDSEAVRQAVAGVTCVIHSAAQVHVGWTGLESQRAINVEGTRHVAAAALDAGAKMVHVSSVDALGIGSPDRPADEDSPPEGKVSCGYVITKRESEIALLEHVKRGLNASIVNPGFMLGPWDWKPSSGRMLLQVARRFTPVAPRGGCSICDVRDVAAGIIAAAERGKPGRRYILGGDNLTYFEFWNLISRVTGARPPMIRAIGFGPYIAGRIGDVMTKVTGREGDVNSASVRMSEMFHYYSSARARQELGYENRPLEETVTDAWNWFKAHGYVTSHKNHFTDAG